MKKNEKRDAADYHELQKQLAHRDSKFIDLQVELSRVKAWIDKVLPDLERLTSNGMVTDMYPETVARLEQALTEYQTLNEPKR